MTLPLQPGAKLHPIALPALAGMPGAGAVDQALILICFPANASEELLINLAQYQEQLIMLNIVGAQVVGLSEADAAQLTALAATRAIRFPLLSDPTKTTLRALGVVTDDDRVSPTVYLVDAAGIVHATYEATRYPDLPKPAVVARAVRKLNDVPRPAPITETDWRLGPDAAAIALIEYSDYQCGHCRTLHAALTALTSEYGDRLLLVHRHLPLRTTHPLAQLAAEAAEAAGAQGRFWEMHHRLFAAEGALERERLIQYAAELGLDVPRFIAELDGRVYQEAVNEDFKRAVAGGIKLPPTLFINGVLYTGPFTEQDLWARVRALLPASLG